MGLTKPHTYPYSEESISHIILTNNSSRWRVANFHTTLQPSQPSYPHRSGCDRRGQRRPRVSTSRLTTRQTTSFVPQPDPTSTCTRTRIPPPTSLGNSRQHRQLQPYCNHRVRQFLQHSTRTRHFPPTHLPISSWRHQPRHHQQPSLAAPQQHPISALQHDTTESTTFHATSNHTMGPFHTNGPPRCHESTHTHTTNNPWQSLLQPIHPVQS